MAAELLANRLVPETFIPTTFQRRLAIRENEARIIPQDQLSSPEKREEQYRRLELMIGNTPLLGLNSEHGLILAKVESQNPSESHYDRAYIATLKRLENDGIIQPGDVLLENTSGSAGTSLAWLCSRLGYRAHIIVPPELPLGRIQEMINFSATVEKSKPGYIPQTGEVIREKLDEFTQNGYEITRHRTGDYFVITAHKDNVRVCLVNHSANQLTVNAFRAIGNEVSELIPRGVPVDYFVSILGNWTTTIGISQALKERFGRLQVVGVEDFANPAFFVEKHPGLFEKLYGKEPAFGQHNSFGASFQGVRLRFADVNMLDEVRLVKHEARDWVQAEYNFGKLLIESIGNTSAASLHTAMRLTEEHPGSIVLVIFYDKNDRYGNPILSETVPGLSYHISDETLGPNMLPRLGWRQWLPVSPVDLPMDLLQVNRKPEVVREQNIRRNPSHGLEHRIFKDLETEGK